MPCSDPTEQLHRDQGEANCWSTSCPRHPFRYLIELGRGHYGTWSNQDGRSNQSTQQSQAERGIQRKNATPRVSKKGKGAMVRLERVDEEYVHLDWRPMIPQMTSCTDHPRIPAMMTITVQLTMHLIAREIAMDMAQLYIIHSPRVLIHCEFWFIHATQKIDNNAQPNRAHKETIAYRRWAT